MKNSMKAFLVYLISVLFFPLGFIVLPSYFIKTGLENDSLHSLLSFGIFFVLIMFFPSPIVAIIVGLYVLFISFSILNLLNAGFDDRQTILISFCGTIMFVVLTNLLLKFNQNVTIADIINHKLTDSLNVLKTVKLDSEFLKDFMSLARQYTKMAVRLSYSFLGIIAFYTSVLNVYIPQRYDKQNNHRFDMFTIDFNFTICVIIGFMLSGLLYLTDKSLGLYVVDNLVNFATYSYFLAGVCLMLYHLRSLSKVYKILAVVICVLIHPGIYFLAILGAINSITNLRKREKNG